MNKTCPKCGKTKDTSNFYRDKSKPDGLTATCKACRRLAQKNYREDNSGIVKKYEDDRRMQESRKEYSREYQNEYRKINKIRVDKYDKRSIARRIINNLIAKNVLSKPTVCEIMPTNKNNIQYHHTNYDYPFVVVAVSHDIHEIIHKESNYTEERHNTIRKIIELIGKRREQYFDKYGLSKYLIALNKGDI